MVKTFPRISAAGITGSWSSIFAGIISSLKTCISMIAACVTRGSLFFPTLGAVEIKSAEIVSELVFYSFSSSGSTTS